MGELVVAGKGKLKGNAESLDRHDRDGANGRADRDVDESIVLAVNGGDLIDHDDREYNHSSGV